MLLQLATASARSRMTGQSTKECRVTDGESSFDAAQAGEDWLLAKFIQGHCVRLVGDVKRQNLSLRAGLGLPQMQPRVRYWLGSLDFCADVETGTHEDHVCLSEI